MNQIHKTLTDDDGNIYKIVPQHWTWVITGLIFVQMVALLILLTFAVSNRSRITALTDHNEIQRQRNLAMDEMLVRRASVQMWTYTQACDYAKSKGEECFPDPKWWADRSKYPALANDPDAQGSGLFPRDQQ